MTEEKLVASPRPKLFFFFGWGEGMGGPGSITYEEEGNGKQKERKRKKPIAIFPNFLFQMASSNQIKKKKKIKKKQLLRKETFNLKSAAYGQLPLKPGRLEELPADKAGHWHKFD